MKHARNTSYKSAVTWSSMLAMYGQYCAYCLEEPAQSIDHVVPWSYSFCDDISNLRPCCMWCNLHASDKYFETFEDKKQYLVDKRKRGRTAVSRTVCTTCFLPYQRPHMTTSMFECPDCDPYKCKSASQKREWGQFKRIMEKAGIHIPFHDRARYLVFDMNYTRKEVKMELGESYVKLVLRDNEGETILSDLHRWNVLSV